jgi:FkbM family methyltransferase
MLSMTSRPVLALRRALRATGIAPILARSNGGYERRFTKALEASVRSGDCVWDVGANVGYYTTRMATLCGSSGHVYAFEPSPTNFDRLNRAIIGLNNATAMPIALSEQNGKAFLRQGDDSFGATSRLVPEHEASISVSMATGDRLVMEGLAKEPNVIKIDVEGHELQTLHGLRAQLTGHALRDIFVEVHFGLLEQARRTEAPATIVQLLKSAGFQVRWIDRSHLHASRILRP